MSRSSHVNVRIDLEKVRANARLIKISTGVPVLAVVKADAYGLGAAQIVECLADIADGFCVFSFAEAVAANIHQATGKTSIALGPDFDVATAEYVGERVRPAVWDVRRAADLRAAGPLLSVDTGMQRFACPPEQIDAVLSAGNCDEAFTHATDLDRVQTFLQRAGNRGLKLHAAGSSLLHEPSARLSAVRPGLALYEGAVRLSTTLVESKKSVGPVGYGAFAATHHGVIRAGYSNGLRIGPCLINGRSARILEVGMQTAYVETIEADKIGDEVVLLGDTIDLSDVARAWKTGPHEVLTRMCAIGIREYI